MTSWGKEAVSVENNISSIEEYRQQRKKKKRKKRLIAALVVLVLLAAIGGIAFSYLRDQQGQDDGGSPVDPTGTASVDTGITANGYPISVGGSNPLDIQACGKNIFLLTKNSVIAFNEKGKQVYTAHHGYSKPVFTASSKRVLTYDQGGYQFRVDSNKSEMGAKKLTEKIVYGAISNDGYTAIVTQTARYTIKLTVYDTALKEVLTWNVSDQVITGIDFNSKSTACAVVTYSVENGTANSKVYELGFKKSGAEQFQTVLSDCMALSVNYQSNGNIGVITDQKAFMLGSGGELRAEWEYVSPLAGFENSSDTGLTVFLEDTASSGNTVIWRIDSEGTKAATGQMQHNVTDACFVNGRLLVVTEKRLLVMDAQLEQQQNTDMESVPTRVTCIGNTGYVLTAGELKQIAVS